MMRQENNTFTNGLSSSKDLGIMIKIDTDEQIYISDRDVSIVDGEKIFEVLSNILPVSINGEPIKFISVINSGLNQDKSEEFFQKESYFVIKVINNEVSNYIANNTIIGSVISLYLFVTNPLMYSIKLEDLFLYQKGEIVSIEIVEEYLISIKCVIGDLLENGTIPKHIITEIEYPCLPISSDGIRMPVLYGNFLNTDSDMEEYDLAPAKRIDDFENIYLASEYKLHSSGGNYYFYDNNLNRYSKIISDVEMNNSDPVSLRHDYSVFCEANYRLKQRGKQMSTLVIPRYLDYINNSSINLQLNSDEALFLTSDEIKSINLVDYYYEGSGFGNVKLSISIGNVSNGVNGIAAKIKYYLDGEYFYIPGNDITELNSNSIVSILITIPEDNYYRTIKRMEFGIVVENNAMVEFRNMVVKIKYQR